LPVQILAPVGPFIKRLYKDDYTMFVVV